MHEFVHGIFSRKTERERVCIASGFFFLWGNLWDANILNIGEEAEGVKKEQQSCCY